MSSPVAWIVAYSALAAATLSVLVLLGAFIVLVIGRYRSNAPGGPRFKRIAIWSAATGAVSVVVFLWAVRWMEFP